MKKMNIGLVGAGFMGKAHNGSIFKHAKTFYRCTIYPCI